MKSNAVRFERQSPTQEQLNVESWLAENEPKLRQYARALELRDTGAFFTADDFYQTMCMKIFMQARLDAAFLSRGNGYVYKSAWNEGLQMIRKQRRYEMLVTSSGVTEDGEDVMENVPAPETDNPEEQVIEKHVSAEELELIRLAIASLPVKSRRIVKLLYAGYRPVDVCKKIGWKGQHNIPQYYLNQIREVFSSFGLQPSL